MSSRTEKQIQKWDDKLTRRQKQEQQKANETKQERARRNRPNEQKKAKRRGEKRRQTLRRRAGADGKTYERTLEEDGDDAPGSLERGETKRQFGLADYGY